VEPCAGEPLPHLLEPIGRSTHPREPQEPYPEWAFTAGFV
jgi:hypothetical protein